MTYLWRGEKLVKVNQWKSFIEIINKTPIGENITRQEILKHVYKYPAVWRSQRRGTPVDRYRRNLDLLGILDKVKLGVYRVNYHVKPDASAKKIRDLAYERRERWKEWFIRKEDRLKEFILLEEEK